VLELLASGGFAGVLELGERICTSLGISVERDHVGIALVGGTNLVAAARECNIEVEA